MAAGKTNGKANGKANGSGIAEFRRGNHIPQKTEYAASNSAYQRKTNRPYPHGTGRPPKYHIDWGMVHRLARCHCTIAEISSILQIPTGTLIDQPEFPKIYKCGFDGGAASVRRKMLRRAMLGSEEPGDTQMLIWLSKHWLGMKETTAQEISGPNGQPIQVMQATVDLNRLNVDDLKQMRGLVLKALPPAGEDGNVG